jgi:hypothetical protein
MEENLLSTSTSTCSSILIQFHMNNIIERFANASL